MTEEGKGARSPTCVPGRNRTEGARTGEKGLDFSGLFARDLTQDENYTVPRWRLQRKWLCDGKSTKVEKNRFSTIFVQEPAWGSRKETNWMYVATRSNRLTSNKTLQSTHAPARIRQAVHNTTTHRIKLFLSRCRTDGVEANNVSSIAVYFHVCIFLLCLNEGRRTPTPLPPTHTAHRNQLTP